MNAFTDVIAAVSTPPGKGGVAVIRMSGDGALVIADKVFSARNGSSLSSAAPRRQIYGYIKDKNTVIDDVMACYFSAPASYTGEDTVEIYCHGGMLVTRTVLELLLRHGAVAAQAGEFTRRAFINGKLTLTDAELIGKLLEAKSSDELALSSASSRERLNLRIEEIKSGITDLMSSIYARIDYPDEDLGDYSDEELLDKLKAISNSLAELISTYKTGRAISEGISAVLCGKPNVGKSSVYNAILGKDAAIVTSLAGTTRDVLESTVTLGRVALKLCDTAGIRTAGACDEVEKIGIERSLSSIDSAELILAVFDISQPLTWEDVEIIGKIKASSAAKIAILNKTDIAASYTKEDFTYCELFDAVELVSTKKSDELYKKLSATVNRLMTDEKINVSDTAIVSSARQHAQLTRTQDYLELAISGLCDGFSQDAVSSDIERALGAISEHDSREVSEAVVSDIFSKFCVGK